MGEPLPGVPVGLVAVEGHAWVAVAQGPYVRLAGGRRLDVGAVPLRMAVAPAGVWVSVFGDGDLALVDTAGNRVIRRAHLGQGAQPEGLVVAGESVYVVDQMGARVVRLDARSGRVRGQAAVGSGPRLIAAGDSALWVTNFVDDTVTRIQLTADGGLGRRVTIPVCRGPQGVVVTAARVLVACTHDDAVAVIDPRTDRVNDTISGIDSADAVIAVGQRVVAIGERGPTAYVIDPASAKVTGRLALDAQGRAADGNVDAVVVGDQLWVTHPTPGWLYHLPVSALPEAGS